MHTTDIARNRNGFEQLKDADFRQLFHERLNSLMQDLEYQVVACAIRKNLHRDLYGPMAQDPYMSSLRVLVERFCYEIGDEEHGGEIVAEKRNPLVDRELDAAWMDLRTSGTYDMQSAKIQRRIVDLTSRHKQANNAALQLADLIVSPIGRFVLGKPVQKDFSIIESKFGRQGNNYHGCGLVVLP